MSSKEKCPSKRHGGARRQPTPYYAVKDLHHAWKALVTQHGGKVLDWGSYNWLPTGHAIRPRDMLSSSLFLSTTLNLIPKAVVDFTDARGIFRDLELEFPSINPKQNLDFSRNKAERLVTLLNHVRRLWSPELMEKELAKLTVNEGERLQALIHGNVARESTSGSSSSAAPMEPTREVPQAASSPRTPKKPIKCPIVAVCPSPTPAHLAAADKFMGLGCSPTTAILRAKALLGSPVPARKQDTRLQAASNKLQKLESRKRPAAHVDKASSAVMKKPAAVRTCLEALARTANDVKLDVKTLRLERYTSKSYLRHMKPPKLLVNVSATQCAQHGEIAKKLYDAALSTGSMTKAALIALRDRFVSEA